MRHAFALAAMFAVLAACTQTPVAAPAASSSPSSSPSRNPMWDGAGVSTVKAKVCEGIASAKKANPEAARYVTALLGSETPPAPGSAELQGLTALKAAYESAHDQIWAAKSNGGDGDKIGVALSAMIYIHGALRDAGADVAKAKQLVTRDLTLSGFATMQKEC